MRILYVTNGFPFPLTSGYLRHYFLIKELSQHHEITLLSIVGANFAAEHAEAMKPYTEQVFTFLSSSKSGSLKRKAINRLRSLVRTNPTVEQMSQTIARLTSESNYDAVLFSGKRAYSAIKHLRDMPLVIDMCDATSMKIRGSMRHARLAKMPLLLLDYVQVRNAERTMMNNAAHMLFASVRDRDALLGQTERATVVPNGVDTEFWQRRSRTRGPNRVVFTGAMDYPPNVDAALYLINEIMPLVRQKFPDAEVQIVGRDPTPPLKRAGQQPGVTVTGFVDDVRPYLEQATVFAAPLRFGAGIQNKLLEALAMETPVVASPLAADGLRTEQGEQPPVQISRNAQEFAERICQQLAAHATNDAPFAEGRQFVERHFVWRRSGQKLDQVFNRVANVVKHEGR